MPRRPREDAPGAVHHVMVRGVERRSIFRDRHDCEGFLGRLGALVPELGFRCFAWALMPNHVHLVLRTGPVPLARLMARLGTGYAGYFNRRHGRVGHLFQNRYRTRRVADDVDLVGLVVYVHLNPLEGGIVGSLSKLATHPWCGHGALIGVLPPRPFESPAATLGLIGRDAVTARRQVLVWMDQRASRSSSPEESVSVGQLEPESGQGVPHAERHQTTIEQLARDACAKAGVDAALLGSRLHSRAIVRARREVAIRATRELGLSGRSVARFLGISESAVSRALARRDPE